MQEVLHESVELVYRLVQKLRASNVHAVEDGELIVAMTVVGGGTGLQDLRVSVLVQDLPDLL